MSQVQWVTLLRPTQAHLRWLDVVYTAFDDLVESYGGSVNKVMQNSSIGASRSVRLVCLLYSTATLTFFPALARLPDRLKSFQTRTL